MADWRVVQETPDAYIEKMLLTHGCSTVCRYKLTDGEHTVFCTVYRKHATEELVAMISQAGKTVLPDYNVPAEILAEVEPLMRLILTQNHRLADLPPVDNDFLTKVFRQP